MAIYINGKKVAGVGMPGKDGKSAYQLAVEGGYQGTEEEFSQILANGGLPSGGTPGQMLYQGESGPEWGDRPVMYVTAIKNVDDTWTVDKTAQEIYEAYQNGVMVYAKYINAYSQEIQEILAPYYILGTSDGIYNCLFYVSASGETMFLTIAANPGTSEDIIQLNSQPITANDVTFTPGTTGLTAKNVQDAIEEVNEKIPSAPKSVSVTLPASGWSSNSQTVTVSGVLADETKQLIQPMPAIASQNAYITAGVICSGQAANQLTFKCSTVPTDDISLYVVITEVRA